MASLEQLIQTMEQAIAAQDVEKGKTALQQAKILLLTSTDTSQNNTAMAVQVWENAVLLGLLEMDLESFGRYMSLLLPHYMNSSDNKTEFPKKYLMIGLHLMHLLVDHRLSEFHSILEQVSEEEASTEYLSYPIGLERQLMVGLYDEILKTKMPDPTYQFFVDHSLLQTVRDSIADGLEVSYESLTLPETADMMKFQNVDELMEFIQDFRDDWLVQRDENKITFSPVDTTVSKSDIAANDWIQQSLQYATEMERIV